MAVAITLNIILLILLILASIQFVTKSRYPLKHAILIISGLLIICCGLSFDSLDYSEYGIVALNFKGVVIFLIGLSVIIFSMFNWQGKMSKSVGANIKSNRWL